MLRRFLGLTLFAALVRGTSLHAQQAQAPVQSSLAMLDSATQVAIAQTIESARAKGLPIEPLVTKARQGAELKRRGQPVTGPQIQAAVRKLADNLEAARTALAPEPTSSEMEEGAKALAMGIPASTLARMRKASPQRSLVGPLSVLMQLVENKVPVARASTVVVDLLDKGAEPKHFTTLAKYVQDDVAAGISLSNALDLRLEGILPTLSGVPRGPVSTELLGPSTSGGRPRPKP